jgi:putative transposase
MDNFSQVLIEKMNKKNPNFSVLDLKARFRAMKYTDEILKLFPEISDPILIQKIYDHISKLGSVNVV